MFNYGVTITCSPHFKKDAEQPWVTQEGDGIISLWMHTRLSLTLEKVAKLIENAAISQAQSQAGNLSGWDLHYQYTATIHNMTIRGRTISQEEMASYPAKDHIRDGETFNLLYSFKANSSRGWLLFCPCCLI